MAVKEIVEYPESADVLRKPSEPVRGISRRVRKLVRDLKDTLSAHPEGIGVAAPQIGAHSRVVVVRLGGGRDRAVEPGPPLPLINPQVIEARDEAEDFDGCLSFPGLYGVTVRPHYLRVAGLDEAGQPFDRVFQGFDALVVHHEIDHLDGVLFVDRVEQLEDLYHVRETEDGELVRVPLSADSSSLPQCLARGWKMSHLAGGGTSPMAATSSSPPLANGASASAKGRPVGLTDDMLTSSIFPLLTREIAVPMGAVASGRHAACGATLSQSSTSPGGDPIRHDIDILEKVL